jgi:hypothetical protein
MPAVWRTQDEKHMNNGVIGGSCRVATVQAQSTTLPHEGDTMRRTPLALTATATALIAASAATALSIPTLPNPSSFVNRIDNKWFPLIPGTVFVYHGEKDGKKGRDVLTVTHSHRTILGIRATVIADRLYLNGVLAERTTDWYAQDKQGNVWYLGESTRTVDSHGRTISTDGTWLAGVNGARAGIYMPANPQPGNAGRQEFYKGHAEDQYKVLSLAAHATSPGASSDHALLTQETTRLEPGTVDHKLYVSGVGTVVEQSIKGPSERLILFSVRHG